MAIIRENISGDHSGGTEVSTLGHTLGFTPTPGNLFVGAFAVTKNTNSPRVPVMPTGWTEIAVSGWQNRGQLSIGVGAIVGGELQVNWSLSSGAGFMGSIVSEISGLQEISTVIDKWGVGNTNTFETGEISQAEEYIFAAQFVDNRTISAYTSISAGYNEVLWIDNGASSPWSLSYVDRIVSAVETPSCTVTHATGDDGWCMASLRGIGGTAQEWRRVHHRLSLPRRN